MIGMMPDRKKLASAILAMPDGKMEKGPEIAQDYSVAEEVCAEKIFKAIESKDKSMLVQGFKDMLEICGGKGEDEKEVEIEVKV